MKAENGRRKRKRAGILAAALGLAGGLLAAGGIYAYLTEGDAHTNPFSIGQNIITGKEEFDPPQPGKKTRKTPRAVNLGSVDCYVRAKVLLSDSRAESNLTFYDRGKEGFHPKWKQEEDGWLYYEEILRDEEESEPIFSHIQLEQDMPAEYGEVSVDVVFESVQAEGFSDPVAAFTAVEGNRKEEGT